MHVLMHVFLRKRRKILKPVTKLSNAKPKQTNKGLEFSSLCNVYHINITVSYMLSFEAAK